jgi:hypothetical protein
MISSHLIDKVKRASSIAIIGNGGNLAIARHAASDVSRHLNKFCFAPECIHLTALGGDEGWHKKWVDQYGSNSDLIIGITTRLDSPIANALQNKNAFLFAPKKHNIIDTIVIDKKTFHEFEVETLWQFYMLMESCGAILPSINN